MKTFSSIAFLLIILCASCGEDRRKNNTPTSGKLVLYYDEGLSLHIKNQVHTFQSTYTNADITLVSSDEKACIEALFNDSCKVIAITRPLTDKEQQKFSEKNLTANTSIVARDAIAFIVHKDFPDSVISLQQLAELLKGKDTAYIKAQHINVVFDSQNSGSARQLKDSLVPDQSFGKNCGTVKSTPELVREISRNPNVIGVCDYAWFSDKDDTITKEFLKSVKLLAVSKNNNETAYMPDQSNIATGDYPLCKMICIIRRSSEFSLGKGIETFIAGEKGQLMFLKQGLPPNRQEERLIEVDVTPLK